MKPYFEIIQGSEDWHRIRWGKISGTNCGSLFTDGYPLLKHLIACNNEPFQLEDEGFVSSAMERGEELQPVAMERLSEYAGINFMPCGWWQSEENEFMGLSPDGTNEDCVASCEIKCPEKNKHTDTLLDNLDKQTKVIPKDNLHQCLYYFAVNPKLEKHFFLSFRPECNNQMFVVEINRKSLIVMGTEKKPITKTVNEWANEMITAASVIKTEVKRTLEKLKF